MALVRPGPDALPASTGVRLQRQHSHHSHLARFHARQRQDKAKPVPTPTTAAGSPAAAPADATHAATATTSLRQAADSAPAALPPKHAQHQDKERAASAAAPASAARRRLHPIAVSLEPTPACAAFRFDSPRLSAARRAQISKRSEVGPQAAEDRGKLTVVLDVDETLIHSRLSSQQEQYRQDEDRKSTVKALDEFVITLADGEVVRVNKRPGLDDFLREASKHYELIAYTAGLEEYARPLLDHLDPEGKFFKHRLYRDSCLFMRGYYLKDMQIVNRPMNRVVLVDNNAFCFLPQLANGIPISSFYDDASDTALQVLAQFLERIRDEQDVRPFLQQSFNLDNLLREHRHQICGGN